MLRRRGALVYHFQLVSRIAQFDTLDKFNQYLSPEVENLKVLYALVQPGIFSYIDGPRLYEFVRSYLQRLNCKQPTDLSGVIIDYINNAKLLYTPNEHFPYLHAFIANEINSNQYVMLDIFLLLLAYGADPGRDMTGGAAYYKTIGEVLLEIASLLHPMVRVHYVTQLLMTECRDQKLDLTFFRDCIARTPESVMLSLSIVSATNLALIPHRIGENALKQLYEVFPTTKTFTQQAVPRGCNVDDYMAVFKSINFSQLFLEIAFLSSKNNSLATKFFLIWRAKQDISTDSKLASLPNDLLIIIARAIQAELLFKAIQLDFEQAKIIMMAADSEMLVVKKDASLKASPSVLRRARDFKSDTSSPEDRATSIAVFQHSFFNSNAEKIRQWQLVRNTPAYKGITIKQIM